MWPYFLDLFYCFSSKSKKHHWIEKHLQQNRFTRHCSRNTKILRFIGLKIFLSNSPSKKQGHIWPGQWEIGLMYQTGALSSYRKMGNFLDASHRCGRANLMRYARNDSSRWFLSCWSMWPKLVVWGGDSKNINKLIKMCGKREKAYSLQDSYVSQYLLLWIVK
jgi:hypothetical protein